VFENRELDITSHMDVSVEDTLWLLKLAIALRQS